MTALHVALLATQRLSDADNGGGQMTSTIIPDNQADNLFADISREDRTAGRVNLRKAIMMGLTADNNIYLGAHVIISAPPSDPDVSALVFKTGGTNEWTNVRTDARDFIESYLVQGPALQCWLYGTHVAGQRSILIFQKPDRPLPSIGDTIVLDDTTTDPEDIQFVRITSISDVVQTFTDLSGNFDLRVITLGINTPLAFKFVGAQPQRLSTPPSPTLVCQTTVADAAKYYGVGRSSADIPAAAVDATLTSIFGQLVPSTQAEVPITNASPQGVLTLVPAATTAPVLAKWNSGVSAVGTWHTYRALVPGSIFIKGSSGSTEAVDDGTGIMHAGTTTDGAQVGTVDYEDGVIVLTANVTNTTSGTIHAVPAAIATQSPYTVQQPVTEGTRGYVYVAVLNPIPQPATLTVSYRSLGRWYDLTDDGSGTLKGADGAGIGVVRFDSGAVSVTLGALPDIGSNVVFSWGQVAQYDIRTGDVDIQIPAISITLSQPAKPSTVNITWITGITTFTVTDNGAGVLSGDGSGAIEYGSGTITLRPTVLPDPATGIAVAYDTNPATTQTLTPSLSAGNITLNLSSAPVAPKSIHIHYPLTLPLSFFINAFGGSNVIELSIVDNGSGGLQSQYGVIAGSTVDYTTGVATFDPSLFFPGIPTPIYSNANNYFWDGGAVPPGYVQSPTAALVGWNSNNVTVPFVNGTVVTVTSTAASATNISTTENFATPSIVLDLTPTTVEPIVPGSVMFTFGGDVYIDRAGSLYRALSSTTGSGTLAGTLDYTIGQATITNWPAGGSSSLAISALLAEFGNSPIGFLSTRVPGQSIRPSSFIIQANRAHDGGLITATADSDGNWTTADMSGHIEVATGFFSVQFGAKVLDSSLTTDDKAEPWYDSANIVSGYIWRPSEVVPGTIKYSCVVETFLPLDPAILGIDPVRLPLDGRVQIFRPGDTVVFREPLAFTLDNPLVASTTYDMPRDGLEDIVLYDQDGVAVDTSNYTTDAAGGHITTTSGMDLTGYTQPIVAVHTRADMVLCVDVQITGQIAWNRPLTNAYPAASSYVSSALVAGDLQANYSNLFTQTTWNIHPATLWEDVVQGTNTTAAFDDVTYPIEVIDRDCITQRWALVFTSATAFQVVGEHLGVIATGNTSTNVAPINGATGNPFFVINHLGFGLGWSTGNAIRFDTIGAGQPIWFARTTLAGAAMTTDDKFSVQLRWDE